MERSGVGRGHGSQPIACHGGALPRAGSSDRQGVRRKGTRSAGAMSSRAMAASATREQRRRGDPTSGRRTIQDRGDDDLGSPAGRKPMNDAMYWPSR